MKSNYRRYLRAAARGVVAIAISGGLLPTIAGAQGSLLEGLVKNASDINIFSQFTQASRGAVIQPRGSHGATGLGFELTYDLSDSTVASGGGSKPLGSSLFGVPMRIEVGAGYAQSGGFKSTNSAIDMYFSLRDLPAFSVYLSPYHAPSGGWEYVFLGAVPYVGMRTGLLSIQSGHAYTDTSTYSLSGQTFQLGPIAGLSWDFGHFSAFTEGAYLWRNYPSLDWSAPAKGGLPAVLPRAIDLSAWNILLGLTVELRPHAGR